MPSVHAGVRGSPLPNSEEHRCWHAHSMRARESRRRARMLCARRAEAERVGRVHVLGAKMCALCKCRIFLIRYIVSCACAHRRLTTNALPPSIEAYIAPDVPERGREEGAVGTGLWASPAGYAIYSDTSHAYRRVASSSRLELPSGRTAGTGSAHIGVPVRRHPVIVSASVSHRPL